MATILDNMPIYMWFQIITKVLLIKFTLTQALNKSLLQNDTQLNRHYTKIGRQFEIQDGGRQGAFLAWHWPSKILIITNLAMYKVSCFYHKMHDFFTYLPHYKRFVTVWALILGLWVPWVVLAISVTGWHWFSSLNLHFYRSWRRVIRQWRHECARSDIAPNGQKRVLRRFIVLAWHQHCWAITDGVTLACNILITF